MPRDLSPQLAALLASGHCKSHDTIKITLGDGTVLHFATATVEVDGTAYQPQIEEVEPLQIGLSQAVDKATFKIQNIDRVIGQVFTGAGNVDGAEAVLGMVWIDEDTGAVYYDERLPGEIVGVEVNEKNVTVTVLSDISAASIGGRLISEVFPFRDLPPAPPVSPPSDGGGGGFGGSGDVGGGGRLDPDFPDFGGHGRYPIMDRL